MLIQQEDIRADISVRASARAVACRSESWCGYVSTKSESPTSCNRLSAVYVRIGRPCQDAQEFAAVQSFEAPVPPRQQQRLLEHQAPASLAGRQTAVRDGRDPLAMAASPQSRAAG